jgi:hypothetical protein
MRKRFAESQGATMYKTLTVIVLALSVAACAGSPNLQPTVQDSETQFIKTNTRDNSQFVLSAEPHSRVALWQVHDKAFQQWGTPFDIKVAAIDMPVSDFSISNVQVTQNGKPVRVMGKKEVDAAIKSDNDQMQAMNLMIGILGTTSSAMAVAHPTSMSAPIIAMNTSSIMVASMAADQTAADSAAATMEVDKVYWSTVNIPEGQMAGGLVTIDGLDSAPVEFTITVGSDVHHIVLSPKK